MTSAALAKPREIEISEREIEPLKPARSVAG